jgi:hypothetical protein
MCGKQRILGLRRLINKVRQISRRTLTVSGYRIIGTTITTRAAPIAIGGVADTNRHELPLNAPTTGNFHRKSSPTAELVI